eukprot:1160300-Pelagomonas_calceolata.AAC.7
MQKMCFYFPPLASLAVRASTHTHTEHTKRWTMPAYATRARKNAAPASSGGLLQQADGLHKHFLDQHADVSATATHTYGMYVTYLAPA